MRIETQKQTLQARDESIKKLLEMLQSKGEGKIFISYCKQCIYLYKERKRADAIEMVLGPQSICEEYICHGH